MSDAEGEREISAYVESPIIMTTVRLVAPFSLTYGLFLMFHSADSSGGGFQGGAIAGATILMIAFAFGIEPTRDWVRNKLLVVMTAGGVAMFALIGLVPMLFGDAFLAHPVFKKELGIKTKYALEGVEILGVAPIVAGIVTGLFFAIASGFTAEDEEVVTDD